MHPKDTTLRQLPRRSVGNANDRQTNPFRRDMAVTTAKMQSSIVSHHASTS